MKRIARDWSPMTQGAEESSPLSRANHCSPAPTQARWTTMARPCQQAPPFSAPRIEGRKLWPLSGLCNPPLASHLDRPNTGGGGVPRRRRQFCSVNAAPSTMIFRASRKSISGRVSHPLALAASTHHSMLACSGRPPARTSRADISVYPSIPPASVSALSRKPSMHHAPFRQERMLLCVYA